MSGTENLIISYNETKEMGSILFETFESFRLFLPEDTTAFLAFNMYHPWILSVIGAVVVGLSGVVPFIIIPLDETASLKSGSSQTLRMLLSFAVGGLLGDVFLHLLPEVWNNARSFVTGKSYSNSASGLWVLAGLLIFIIVEKMCSFDKEDEVAITIQTDDLDKVDKTIESATTAIKSGNHTNNKGITTLPVLRKKSTFIANDSSMNYSAELKLLRSLSSTIANNNNMDDLREATSLTKKSSNIHISGYLNLVANSIDNFTHGLAVGGSFLLSTRIGLLTTFAILVHEIPHEVGDFAILLRAGFSRLDAAWAQMYTASAGILGALTALMFNACSNEVEARTSWILPFTAGGFLHIALVTVLPELLNENNPKESLKQMCSLVSGITVMRLLTMLVEG